MPPGPAPHRPWPNVRSAADQLAAVAAAFEVDTTRAAPRSVTGPRDGDGVLDADLWAGRAEALGERVPRRDRRRRSPSATSRSDGPSRATCCRSPGRGTTPPSRSSLGGPPSAVAWHWLVAHDPRGRPGGGDRGGRRSPARATPRPTSWPSLELALSLPEGPAPGGSARRRAAPASDRVDLQVRASEAAFAVGRMSRATAYLESAIGGLDARRDRVRLGLLHERLAHVRRAAGDPAGAMLAARRAVELVPREPSPERATVLAALAQLKMLDGIFSEAQRLARDAIKVARACDPVARDQEVHATTTLAVALAWGKDPSRRDRAAARGGGAPRASSTIPTPSSGSAPT